MEVRITKLHPSTKIATDKTASGLDLFAHLDTPVLLCPGMRKLIPTGISIQLAPHVEAHLRPKRALAIEYGVTILDAPQVIRAGEDQELQVLLINLGQKGFSVKPGMAIAEMAIAPVYQAKIQIVPVMGEDLTEFPDVLRHSTPFIDAHHHGIEVLTLG